MGERQRVEIIRALLQEPKLLIMDEPTSVLTPFEADNLFSTLRKLSDNGTSILYISHKLQEIAELCDTATVLRKGEVIGEHEVTFSSGKEIITLNHEAFDRALYSEGAFTAAKWLMKKKPGLYSMRDVLNFK